MNRGDIITFKGKGLTFTILSFFLSIFDKDWHRLKWKPWHTAIAWEHVHGGWNILEATAGGVQCVYYENRYLDEHTRSWKWLDKSPTRKKQNKFFEGHILKHYDVLIYFWTSLQYLTRHYFNRRIPRLLDDRYSCWELVFEFCREMGKPLSSIYDCPMITDLLKAIHEVHQNIGDSNEAK